MELDDLVAEAIIKILLETIVGQKETIKRLQMQLELKEMEEVEI